jgi:hypothetical protein
VKLPCQDVNAKNSRRDIAQYLLDSEYGLFRQLMMVEKEHLSGQQSVGMLGRRSPDPKSKASILDSSEANKTSSTESSTFRQSRQDESSPS